MTRKTTLPPRGGVEQNCEPMDKNRIEGATDQGEQA